MTAPADIAIVGAGAAGLFAATWAARTNPQAQVLLIDSAKLLGAKILVAGGGRCNVTHYRVGADDYRGGKSELIRSVLRRFPVESTVEFFASRGVALKQEETGKLFPVSDRARSVLDALIGSARELGVQFLNPSLVESIEIPTQARPTFLLHTSSQTHEARRVILCTGGKSLPKSGSDGRGLAIASTLGHQLTPLIEPALVPLTVAPESWITQLSGLASQVELRIVTGDSPHTRKVHRSTSEAVRGAMLCTHFGLSGPAILDISRHWIHAAASDPTARLRVNWLPGETPASIENELSSTKGQSVLALLHGRLPDRILRAICRESLVEPATGLQQVTRVQRNRLALALTAMDVEVTGSRGFTAAETTAGGIALDQLHIDRMESRIVPGMFICGEMVDVDGRIGGFSFQWAWASGFVAGCAAAASLSDDRQ